MSSEILYDKAFIKVGDGYIPIVNQGSSNCFDFGLNGQQIPEKHWHILNFFCRSKVLFSEQEIIELADRMENLRKEGAPIMKSRYKGFEDGELRNWVLAGMKRAFTVEEYVKCGNTILLEDLDINPHTTTVFTTAEQLLKLLEEKKNAKELDISYANSRMVYRPKKKKVDKLVGKEKVYVLMKTDANGRERYFCRYRRKRYVLATDSTLPFVRLFVSEKEAQRYLQKYREQLKSLGLSVKCIDNPRNKRKEMTT